MILVVVLDIHTLIAVWTSSFLTHTWIFLSIGISQAFIVIDLALLGWAGW